MTIYSIGCKTSAGLIRHKRKFGDRAYFLINPRLSLDCSRFFLDLKVINCLIILTILTFLMLKP